MVNHEVFGQGIAAMIVAAAGDASIAQPHAYSYRSELCSQL